MVCLSLPTIRNQHFLAFIPNMTEVVTLAEAKKLTAYDASFLWLALQLDVELVTLDKTLAKQVSPRKAK